MREVSPYCRPKADASGVIQRLGHTEENYFHLSVYCEPGTLEPEPRGGTSRLRDQGLCEAPMICRSPDTTTRCLNTPWIQVHGGPEVCL